MQFAIGAVCTALASGHDISIVGGGHHRAPSPGTGRPMRKALAADMELLRDPLKC